MNVFDYDGRRRVSAGRSEMVGLDLETEKRRLEKGGG